MSCVQPVKESVVEAHLKKRVAELGGETRKVQWIGRRGAPDRLVLLPAITHPGGIALRPRAYWVELKRPRGGVLSQHQKDEHEALKRAGQTVLVMWSVEMIDDVFGHR